MITELNFRSFSLFLFCVFVAVTSFHIPYILELLLSKSDGETLVLHFIAREWPTAVLQSLTEVRAVPQEYQSPLLFTHFKTGSMG